MRLIIFLTLLSVLLSVRPERTAAQKLDNQSQTRIAEAVSRMVDREVLGGGARLDSYNVRGKRLRLNFSIGLANYPFREGNVAEMYDTVRSYLPQKLQKHRIEIYTDSHLIEELVPLAERSSFDRHKVRTFTNKSSHPLVQRLSWAASPSKGLQGRHIALWQSHGYYFDQGANRWRWQRTAQWMTREDLFTQTFVLPYLVPMLEAAGANVLLPRERDLNSTEIIIDSDNRDAGTHYHEVEGRNAWEDGGIGFGHMRAVYRQGENPFHEGRHRKTTTVGSAKQASFAQWEAEIAESGQYALYVSYQSYPNSCREARYTVHHAGGESHFLVNQRMGGGTWIYLGSFRFEAGNERPILTLSNQSDRAGEVVVADAVKIGGGEGNIVRTPCDSLRRPGINYRETTSGMPRYMEGSRYWLQWAGFDEKIYLGKEGKDDYKEDYMSRAHWVNALMGGSERLPDSVGLAIPIDLALAFHTDAGVRDNDETIGTLGIFYTKENKESFAGGASRYRSRDLTDLVMTEIVEDIRTLWEPAWRRRGLWNRAYYEARMPAAPTMLLELLSHQNFADMRYGHDPRFKFTVSRAIYKGILKHIATQYGYPYVVQPLPVRCFGLRLADNNQVTLSWAPRPDSLEQSAMPDSYILYRAVDDGDFDNGIAIKACSITLEQEPGRHYRYRLTAVNAGGESFPSETLAACIVPDAKGEVLIVNGFTRVSAAPSFRTEQEAGFSTDYDGGVSYLRDIGYIGAQQIFDRALYDAKDPEKATGGSLRDMEGVIPAGNTFDYPALHGRSIAASGYSYASCSVDAFTHDAAMAQGYEVVDLILGKQRSSMIGHGGSGYDFACFPKSLQERLRQTTADGCNLLISGCYVASDLWESECSTDADRRFAREVLHFEHFSSQASRRGRVRGNSPSIPMGSCHFNQQIGEEIYAAESPDALTPVGSRAYAFARYGENNRVAGVAYEGERYRVATLGFPFETISELHERNRVMEALLGFLNSEN